MSDEPMELAKNWDEKHYKKVLPAYAQIKYDGVPLTFIRPLDGGQVLALTRQNEVALSVPHLLAAADLLLLTPGASFTAECLVPGKPFKDSSGIIRRQEPDAETAEVIGIVFDYNVLALPKETYHIRKSQFENVFVPMREQWKVLGRRPVFAIPQSIKVETVEQVDAAWAHYTGQVGKDIEGMMMHSLVKPWNPGKRCWGMSRYKPQPTIDLEVLRFVEATSEAGEPLGMLGRVEVLLRRAGRADSEVGIGPGKLTHEEREAIWRAATPLLSSGLGKRIPVHKTFAEIKYMPDPTYDALRQPTVQRFRWDKDEGDVLEY